MIFVSYLSKLGGRKEHRMLLQRGIIKEHQLE